MAIAGSSRKMAAVSQFTVPFSQAGGRSVFAVVHALPI
jgi:hypothetical protein